ncbi:hypothetical protein [Thiosulfativibrio zosterae]|uniref:Lipoprotein n=1 Tax=Thiosulfativibrio zosterae TaxID=2675053 RepID=A0A6F8PPF0_9GAMM|nr:hypothetical protein [Thiosulfativibrio zosterae]BBP43870.1 hypothetical protein THMIRHAT_16160 [Thiosulfativibrio zosterae]
MKKIYMFSGLALLAAILVVSFKGNNDKVAKETVIPIDNALSADSAKRSSAPKSDLGISLKSNDLLNNPYAYIPSQCYTKTNVAGQVHNPCFSCHTVGQEPNYIDDSEFQLVAGFRATTQKNAWTNLFKDRTSAVNAISDDTILNYVNKTNYLTGDGKIELAERLKNLPENWDYDGNGKWDGYTPDCYYHFDSEGYDQDPSGKDTGWRAFAYSPFLGTFWPTNGSTDDVLIRLPESMRQDSQGQYSREVYNLNLSIVLAMIQRQNITIPETDENIYGVDLNKNGQLDKAKQVVYDWAPLENKLMFYVGKAKSLQEAGSLHLAAGLYPEGTEFLHSVRYLALDDKGQVTLSPRLKELRYGKKLFWNTYFQLKNATLSEIKEGDLNPDRLRRIKGDAEFGLSNGVGWVYQGFIENVDGKLRPQNFEETLNCMGCHSGIGITTDSSFAFPRKLDTSHYQQGWYHWTQKSLAGLKEPKFKDGTYQYTEYLLNNHSANEFRNNDEVITKFWNSDGSIKQDQLSLLHDDIAELLIPSRERALQLNKAYKVIVDEQSYIYSRDAHVKPLDEVVWQEVPEGELTGVTTPVIHH